MSSDGKEKSSKGGRPAGAKNIDRPEVSCHPPRCPSCGSTNRGPFRDGVVNRQDCHGTIDGHPFNLVVWRNTSCEDCGQLYRVRMYYFSKNGEIPDAPV